MFLSLATTDKDCDRRALLGDGRVVMADLAKEQGEKSMKEFEKEFGVGKVCFVHLDVRDVEMWKDAWDEAEKFFGGQVQVSYFSISQVRIL